MTHGLINYLDTKAKCRHLKKITCKEILRQVFIRVYRLEIQSVNPALWAVAPLTFSLVLLSPPLPVSKYSIYSTNSVWPGGGGGCWVLLETMFCRSLTLCIWPESEPTKLLDHPKQKPSREGGLRHTNTCRNVPLLVNLFRWWHFALVSTLLISPWCDWSTVCDPRKIVCHWAL
jgi:hypothetical protein